MDGADGACSDIPSRSTFSASGPWSRAPSRATTKRHGHSAVRRGRVHHAALLRQSRRRVRPCARRAPTTGCGRGPRDEPLRDRLPARRRRRLRPALVHADRRGRPLRPRHARQRPRALGAGPGSIRAHARFQPRAVVLTAARRGGWIELDFPGRSRRRRRAARAPRRARASRAALRWPTPTRLPRRAGLRGGRSAPSARLRRARRRTRPARGVIVTAARASRRRRLRLPLLRTRGRHRRGPRHRLRPLLPRPLLGAAPRQVRADGLSGVRPRRHRRRAPLRRRPGRADRPGGDGVARRAALTPPGCA